ncbi:MAG: hypothetical protein ACRDRU_11730 [Pseudonocardiaceae bacterium]
MTDRIGPPAEIEIQTNGPPTVQIRDIISCTDTDVLVITASNAEVVLAREWARIRGGHDRDWVVPLGILLPISLALLTSNFGTKFGVSGDAWKMLFLVAALGSAGWLVRELIQRKRRKPALTPRQVVDLLKVPPQATPSTPGVARNHVSSPPWPGSLGTLNSRYPQTLVPVQDRARGPGAPVVAPRVSSGGPGPKVSPGNRVRHPTFGIATVLGFSQGQEHTFVVVQFDDRDVGTKKLRLDLAPLQLVEDAE